MKKFFFDVSFRDHVRYDYRGRDFAQPEQARELAELIALDIEFEDDSNVVGLEVQVRNIGGKCIYAVPVRPPDRLAA